MGETRVQEEAAARRPGNIRCVRDARFRRTAKYPIASAGQPATTDGSQSHAESSSSLGGHKNAHRYTIEKIAIQTAVTKYQ